MPPREGHRAARVTPASRNASVPAAGLLAAGVAHARSSPDCMTGVRCTVCMRVTGASTRPANAASTVPTQSQPPTPPPPTALVAASCNAQRSVFGGEAITAALARRAPHVPFWARSKVFDRGLRPDKSGPGLGRRASQSFTSFISACATQQHPRRARAQRGTRKLLRSRVRPPPCAAPAYPIAPPVRSFHLCGSQTHAASATRRKSRRALVDQQLEQILGVYIQICRALRLGPARR